MLTDEYAWKCDARTQPDSSAVLLAAQVHERSRGVIDAEIERLSHRAPSLRPSELHLIDTALDNLVETLIMARLRGASRGDVPLLGALFGTTTAAG